MKRSRPVKPLELCACCSKNPRRPFSENCVDCSKEIRAEQQRERRAKARETRPPKPLACKCGCDLPVFYPARYATPKCKTKARAASVKKWNAGRKKAEKPKLRGDHGDRFGLKPHRPAKVQTVSEEEAAALDAERVRVQAEAFQHDRERHRQYCAAMGLVCVPDRPLASPVRMLSPEEVKRLERVYQPPEKVVGGVMLPLRADMVYY